MERLEGRIVRVMVPARPRSAEREAGPPLGGKRVSHVPDPHVCADRCRPEPAPFIPPFHVPLPLTVPATRDRSRRPDLRRRGALREPRRVAVVPKHVHIEPNAVGTKRHGRECAPGISRRIPCIVEQATTHPPLATPKRLHHDALPTPAPAATHRIERPAHIGWLAGRESPAATEHDLLSTDPTPEPPDACGLGELQEGLVQA